MWYVTALISDLILCLERSSLSPLALHLRERSPVNSTSNSLRINPSPSSMYSISERKE